jgi:hypothetical protein
MFPNGTMLPKPSSVLDWRPAMPKENHPEQDPAEGSRSVIERNLERQHSKGPHQRGEGKDTEAEKDSKGQFVQSRNGSTNDGVSSADPRVLSGKPGGDATWPLKQDKSKQS